MDGDLERFVLTAHCLPGRPCHCSGGHSRQTSQLCPAVPEEANLIQFCKGEKKNSLDTDLSLVSMVVTTVPVDGLGESH